MKRSIPYLAFGTCFLAACLLFGYWARLAPSLLVGNEASVETVIILDAGHGGEDGGATGVNGVLEKDLNLSITHTLAELLRMSGYTVIESRTDDRLLYDESTKTGQKKRDDLKNRLALTEQHPNSVLISIHMNTFPNDSCMGTQVWYSPNHTASAEWASAVQESVKNALQPTNNRKIKAATSSIYLLRHAQTPAILIECGFLSTPAECEQLCDGAYQKALVLTLFGAICEKMQAQS